jgi:hypothetical protein
VKDLSTKLEETHTDLVKSKALVVSVQLDSAKSLAEKELEVQIGIKEFKEAKQQLGSEL